MLFIPYFAHIRGEGSLPLFHRERMTALETVRNAIRMEHITKRFGNVVANHDINLELHKGEILSLLGENGSG